MDYAVSKLPDPQTEFTLVYIDVLAVKQKENEGLEIDLQRETKSLKLMVPNPAIVTDMF